MWATQKDTLHAYKLTRWFYVLCTLSQILRRHVKVCYILKTFQFYVFYSSILWRFEINLLNYLFMRSTTIWYWEGKKRAWCVRKTWSYHIYLHLHARVCFFPPLLFICLINNPLKCFDMLRVNSTWMCLQQHANRRKSALKRWNCKCTVLVRVCRG